VADLLLQSWGCSTEGVAKGTLSLSLLCSKYHACSVIFKLIWNRTDNRGGRHRVFWDRIPAKKERQQNFDDERGVLNAELEKVLHAEEEEILEQ